MNYNEFLKSVKQGKLKHLYLVYGKEQFIVKKVEKLFINALLKSDEIDIGLTVYESDPVPSELAAGIESYPFMSSHNVIIIKNSKLLKNAKKNHHADEDKNSEEYLAIFTNIPEWCYVMLMVTDDKDIDKRRKVYKTLEQVGEVIECQPLKAKDVRGWIKEKLDREGVSITRNAENQLFAALSLMPEISLGFLNNEIDKMITYITPSTTIDDQVLNSLFAGIPEVSVFTLLEAISSKDISQALHLLRSILTGGTNELNAIGLIAFHVRRLWRTKEFVAQGKDVKFIAGYFKVPLFVGEKLVNQSAGFSTAVLKQAVMNMSHANLNIRYVDNKQVILEKIILDMCR